MGLISDIAKDSGREFCASHPWMGFRIDLRSAQPRFWQLLGEAQGLCRQLAFSPIKPHIKRDLEALYVAKGVQATTAIEGNTLSIEQVRAAVRGELRVPPSQEYLKQEVENVIAACRVIEARVRSTRRFELSMELLQKLNELVLRDLDHEDHVLPGKLRDVSVVVGQYRAAPPSDVAFLTRLMVRWLESDDFVVEQEDMRLRFLRMFLKAVAAHLYIAWIHPFGDGNGRTARLVEFGILTAAGIPTIAAHLLSNHYNLTRTEYYRQLQRASDSGGDLAPFLLYAAQGFVDLLGEQVAQVQQAVTTYAWESYVYEHFRLEHTPKARRRRDLVLELGYRWPEPSSRSALTALTPAIAAQYAGKHDKTLTRDLNALVESGLIGRLPDGRYAAQMDVMFRFMPLGGAHPAQNTLIELTPDLRALLDDA